MTPTALETLRGWISTGTLLAMLGFIARLWVMNRKLRMQEKVEDRQGFGELINAMRGEMARLRERVETLERERDGEHKLIIALLNQSNRTQAIEIMGLADVSPELRRAFETTISGTDTSQ